MPLSGAALFADAVCGICHARQTFYLLFEPERRKASSDTLHYRISSHARSRPSSLTSDFFFCETLGRRDIFEAKIFTPSFSNMSMLKFAVVAAAIAGGAVEARKASRGSLRASKSAPLRSSSGTCSGTTYDFFML